jgi:23S rRNA pseudouridine1911/1915/1917 synthase
VSTQLLEVLRARGLAGNDARRALESGKVWIQGMPTSDGGRDVVPDEVELRPDAPRLSPGRDVAILHRDRHVALVYKPAGVLAVAAPGRARGRDLMSQLARILGAALPVHRLDEGTSGVMAVALTPEGQAAMKGLFERHAIERRYLALVQGVPPEAPTTVRGTLVRDRGDGRRGSGNREDATAREAITHLRRLEALRGAALVEARLETGRTHQIRIHLAEQGFPILGDDLYGRGNSVRRSPRLALHAAVLAFRHPLTGEDVARRIPLADDLEILRRRMRTG